MKVRSEGLEAHHPMIMIPGVISTGLESWGTANASRPYFRKRFQQPLRWMDRCCVLNDPCYQSHSYRYVCLWILQFRSVSDLQCRTT